MAEGTDAGDDPADASHDPPDSGGEGPTIAGRRPTPPETNRVRNSMVWGVAASLWFAVLHQAYVLLGGTFVGFVPVIAVGLGVGVLVAMGSYLAMDRLAARNEQG
jgi:hypothetical protein